MVVENWLNATFRVHYGEHGRAVDTQIHTHTHTVKWANFPRVHACCCTSRHSPVVPSSCSCSSYPARSRKTSPIGFFNASKFLVSQPASRAWCRCHCCWPRWLFSIPVRDRGAKGNAAGLVALEKRKNCIGSLNFLFPISELCCMSRARIRSFFGGGVVVAAQKVTSKVRKREDDLSKGVVQQNNNNKTKWKVFKSEFILFASVVCDFQLNSLTFEGFTAPHISLCRRFSHF